MIFAAMVFAGSWLISRRAVAPIEKAWQKQLEFTDAASHELRTPLAALRANLELVMDCREETVASQMKWLTWIWWSSGYGMMAAA
ncbi:MAG: histidine kinase dimerization/phospho-acceptor domain-containing protein [Anaerovibrio sp.]